ncbi:hypothetical protein D3C71_1220470 [compost metagenome]
MHKKDKYEEEKTKRNEAINKNPVQQESVVANEKVVQKEATKAISDDPSSQFVSTMIMIDALLEAKDDDRIVGHSFAFKIIPSIKSQGWVSPKQQKFIEDAFKAIIPPEPSTPPRQENFVPEQGKQVDSPNPPFGDDDLDFNLF